MGWRCGACGDAAVGENRLVQQHESNVKSQNKVCRDLPDQLDVQYYDTYF